jgi:DNA repair protein RAD50
MLAHLLLGSLEELESRSEQFEDSINIQKENKRLEERKLEDTEEELNSQIAQQRSLIVQKGRLLAEAEVSLSF